MVNNSYICGAEINIQNSANTDLGGVPDYILAVLVWLISANFKGASLSLYIY